MSVSDIRTADMGLVHPLAVKAFRNLEAECRSRYVMGDMPFEFRVFETYRHPARQRGVFQLGHSRALPYQSAHQFGLAVDFVPWTDAKKWHWDVEIMYWSTLKGMARGHGLDVPLSWDKAHVEHPLWNRVRLALWNEHDPIG